MSVSSTLLSFIELLFTLIHTAQVCPDSAKVQLNLGILERRYSNWQAALAHFNRARQIEPGYCEPTYWFGLSLVNEGRNLSGGVQVIFAS